MSRLQKKNKRVSRYEAISEQHRKLREATAGNGLFVYRNRSNHASLKLPKPCKDGRIEIPPNGEFEGDDYFDMLVKNNAAVLVRTVEIKKESVMLNESKLILDQPEIVTTNGTVEHVVVDEMPVSEKKKKGKKNESTDKGDILLTDSSLEGIQILG